MGRSRSKSVSVTVLLCGLFSTTCRVPPTVGPVSPVSSIDLTVLSTQPQFSVGEPVRLTLALKNNSADTVALQTTVPGCFRILSVTRDGQAVSGRTTPIFYVVPLLAQFSDGFVSVKRGAGLQVAYASQRDYALPSAPESLYSVDYNSAAPEITYYSLSQPGDYVVTFQYQYPGPDAPLVSRAASLAGRVLFSVVP